MSGDLPRRGVAWLLAEEPTNDLARPGDDVLLLYRCAATGRKFRHPTRHMRRSKPLRWAWCVHDLCEHRVIPRPKDEHQPPPVGASTTEPKGRAAATGAGE
jgi:hypothetical protein